MQKAKIKFRDSGDIGSMLMTEIRRQLSDFVEGRSNDPAVRKMLLRLVDAIDEENSAIKERARRFLKSSERSDAEVKKFLSRCIETYR